MAAETQIPIIDFGGRGLSLHFAHANAYPPRCYRRFLKPLTSHYHVWAMEQRPLWPGADPAQLRDWSLFAADFLRLLAQRAEGRIIAIGHSLGAVVSMMAAAQSPELFAVLVLVEPVLLPPALLQAARDHPQQAARTPLVQRARNRRHRWPNRQAAFDHFRDKPVFRRLSDEDLWDYVNYGLAESVEGEVHLRFSREWETRIYSHPPLAIWDLLSRIKTPTLAIRGEHSDTIQLQDWQSWQKLQPAAEFVEMPASGHLAPLERPSALAALTHDFLARLPY